MKVARYSAVSYTHLDVYKRQGIDRVVIQKIDQHQIADAGRRAGSSRGSLVLDGQPAVMQHRFPSHGTRVAVVAGQPLDISFMVGDRQKDLIAHDGR